MKSDRMTRIPIFLPDSGGKSRAPEESYTLLQVGRGTPAASGHRRGPRGEEVVTLGRAWKASPLLTNFWDLQSNFLRGKFIAIPGQEGHKPWEVGTPRKGISNRVKWRALGTETCRQGKLTSCPGTTGPGQRAPTTAPAKDKRPREEAGRAPAR